MERLSAPLSENDLWHVADLLDGCSDSGWGGDAMHWSPPESLQPYRDEPFQDPVPLAEAVQDMASAFQAVSVRFEQAMQQLTSCWADITINGQPVRVELDRFPVEWVPLATREVPDRIEIGSGTSRMTTEIISAFGLTAGDVGLDRRDIEPC